MADDNFDRIIKGALAAPPMRQAGPVLATPINDVQCASFLAAKLLGSNPIEASIEDVEKAVNLAITILATAQIRWQPHWMTNLDQAVKRGVEAGLIQLKGD